MVSVEYRKNKMLRMLLAKDALTSLDLIYSVNGKGGTDMCCCGSGFKVLLYTGDVSWGQVYWKVVLRMKYCSCFQPVE